MPCVYDGPDDRIAEARSMIDRLTNMLCKQCALSERKKTPIHADVKKWWVAHQVSDNSRKRAEEYNRLEALRIKQRQIKELKEEIEALSNPKPVEAPVRRRRAKKALGIG